MEYFRNLWLIFFLLGSLSFSHSSFANQVEIASLEDSSKLYYGVSSVFPIVAYTGAYVTLLNKVGRAYDIEIGKSLGFIMVSWGIRDCLVYFDMLI